MVGALCAVLGLVALVGIMTWYVAGARRIDREYEEAMAKQRAYWAALHAAQARAYDEWVAAQAVEEADPPWEQTEEGASASTDDEEAQP